MNRGSQQICKQMMIRMKGRGGKESLIFHYASL